jgi:hypothetical protein
MLVCAKYWFPKVIRRERASKQIVWMLALKKHFEPRKETEFGILTDGISQYSKHDASILCKDDGHSRRND